MSTTTAIMAQGGRDASRVHRAQQALGKAALPPPSERTRNGGRSAMSVSMPIITPTSTPVFEGPVGSGSVTESAPAFSVSGSRALSGRDWSRARREAMVRGKNAVREFAAAGSVVVPSNESELTRSPTNYAVSNTVQAGGTAVSARMTAQAMRAARSRSGRGDAPAARPSGRGRNNTQFNYAPKVTPSETYGGGRVTGVRIGHSWNVTGDERGAAVQVTGSQYIGKETGFQPRDERIKVGASRTAAGLIVTGTQVRSKVSITGDEYASSVHITGEADQKMSDDLLDRTESGAYASMQFQRQHNPHGHTVFGLNLGRSPSIVGSRERSRERALEFTDGGLPISGSAVGRSANVTGAESGTCRPITGDQYLMPPARQPLCETDRSAGTGGKRAPWRDGRSDPVTGAKVTESETWTHQRVTGVDVEHNDHVTGDEYGACSIISGTPYVGPAQYGAVCPGGAPTMPQSTAGGRVTGDTPISVERVTGTRRGAERNITGTPYYREELDGDVVDNVLARINTCFSVRSPQREAHLRVRDVTAESTSAAERITGSFAVGDGKITGNQEFIFTPREKGEQAGRIRVTGEGRVEGVTVTGSAWTEDAKVTGTEDYIAAERNPSERSGNRQSFAGSASFKGKGRHEEPRKIVTGMVGWSPKSAARVTLSGGAQG